MRSRKRHLFRRLPFLFACLVCCSLVLIYYVRYQWTEDLPFQVLSDDSIKNFFVKTSGCQIPAWNPWDDSVKLFYKPVAPYKCPGQPSFLRILANGIVTVEDALLRYYYEIEREKLSCVFQEISRDTSKGDEDVDSRISMGKIRNLTLDQPLGIDYIKTVCTSKMSTEETPQLFDEFLPLTPLKTDVENRCVQRMDIKTQPLNVIFLGIDSISNLNFQRHFPKCQKYLSSVLSSIHMKGYTKVGDNTFPNIMPLLTGHFYQHYYDEVRNKSMFFDDVDFLWKLFAKHGYRTLLAEDAPDIATFNYYRKGFKNPPTDYYFRPFALAVENSDLKLKSKGQCFGSKMEMEVVYDYLRSFVDTMGSNRPFFAFVFLARLTHDSFNFAGYADEPTYKLLRYLHDSGTLNNTMLIFFSDHGIRYGPIRKTYIGQFEERMPFIHLILPKWFLEKHKLIHKNLISNSERLTTPFDIHATIAHLATMIIGKSHSEKEPTRGISLFREIPENRTCSQASITPHWCPCQIHKAVSRDDLIVLQAASTVIETVNNLTHLYRSKCAVLSLNRVLDARIADGLGDNLIASENQINSTFYKDYLIVLSTSPSDAIFEATVRCEPKKKGECTVIDDISRINEYGKQSICISDAKIRKFCYCI